MWALVGCREVPADPPAPATETTPPVDSPTPPGDSGVPAEPRLDLPPSGDATTAHVSTAARCADCHAAAEGDPAMRDGTGAAVGPSDLWPASLMANAARDPFWWAAVSYEAEPWLRVQGDIEGGCMVCHAPGLALETRLDGSPAPTLEALRGEDATARVGLDGVTCTVCHQIAATDLGEEATFNGAFATEGVFRAYGPYEDPVVEGMSAGSDYVATYGAHTTDAGLCASCHMVQNTVLGVGGEPTSRHTDEQLVFREWQASAFDSTDGATPRTCASCHMPAVGADGAPIVTAIARDPGGVAAYPARTPVGLHGFLGANTFVLALLRDNTAELAPEVPPEAFDAQITATRSFLGTAARLVVDPPTREGDTLRVPIRVENLTGHKLPTGFPSRRMWLDVRVRDGAGATVFRSGAADAEGRLVDVRGEPLDAERVYGPAHPHRESLSDGQVQVWEAVFQDNTREPVYLLLVATRLYKDDRLLPAGWDGGDGSMDPVGVDGDPNFAAGSDTVELEVDAPAANGPYTLTAALRYQSVGARYLDEVLEGSGAPVRVFERMVEAADRTPETLAELETAL